MGCHRKGRQDDLPLHGEGKKYLDFGAGIAVFALGYNNKEFNEAIKLANICDKKLKNAEEALTKIVKEDNQLENFEINAE